MIGLEGAPRTLTTPPVCSGVSSPPSTGPTSPDGRRMPLLVAGYVPIGGWIPTARHAHRSPP